MLGARRILRKECKGYLALVKDAEKEMVILDEVPVVTEFPDAFLEELPGLPSNQEIEFSIDMVPGTKPISIPSYRMALTELKELKEQL